MVYRGLQITYFNILIIIFIYINMPILSLILFVIRASYLIWKNAFQPLNFLAINEQEEDEWLRYVDYDTDSNYYFKKLKGEFYLWFNCNFVFYYEGGEDMLNYVDSLDLVMYKMHDKKNFRYIYKDTNYKVKYNKSFYFNNAYKRNYNLKYNIKLLNEKTFNILNNVDKMACLNNIKKYYYYKKG